MVDGTADSTGSTISLAAVNVVVFDIVFTIFGVVFSSKVHRNIAINMYIVKDFLHIIGLFCIMGYISAVFCKESLDPGSFHVWGSGINSDHVVPARFFYVQAVNSDGDK